MVRIDGKCILANDVETVVEMVATEDDGTEVARERFSMSNPDGKITQGTLGYFTLDSVRQKVVSCRQSLLHP